MAFAWWVATGTFQQMEKEITTSKEFRGHFEMFWKYTNEAKIAVLKFDHILPSLILLACGLGPATVALCLELLHHSWNKGPAHGENPGEMKLQVK